MSVARHGTIILMAALAAGASVAQTLSDPMQPPAFVAPSTGVPGAEPAVGAPVLQSTLMSKGRRMAMIGGKPMQIGDRIGEARIVGIEPASVMLREAGVTRVLGLYQGVEKTQPKAEKADAAKPAPRPVKGSKRGTK